MPISNEIFETFRIQERVKEQLKAIKLLIKQGYTIFDLEGNMLNKDEVKFDARGNRVKTKQTQKSYK